MKRFLRWVGARWNAFRLKYPDGDHLFIAGAYAALAATLLTLGLMLHYGASKAATFNTALLGVVVISALIGACQHLSRRLWLGILTGVALVSWFLSMQSSALVDCWPISGNKGTEARR